MEGARRGAKLTRTRRCRYVGYEEGGQLTEAVRRRPFQVVLLDEFEKAHREVANLLLQVFDEGRLTDSQGRTVDFRNTIVIMTSNLGSDVLASMPDHVPASDPAARAAVLDRVRAEFPPEFINRIDDLIVFDRLRREHMDGIVGIQLDEVRGLLKDKRIELDLDAQAQTWLAQCVALGAGTAAGGEGADACVRCRHGFDSKYGARPLKRTMQAHLLNPLAMHLLSGRIRDDERVHVTVGDDDHLLVKANHEAVELDGVQADVELPEESGSEKE